MNKSNHARPQKRRDAPVATSITTWFLEDPILALTGKATQPEGLRSVKRAKERVLQRLRRN